jgi:rod shape-determining protein MreC
LTAVRDGTVGKLGDFLYLMNARQESIQLRKENDRLKLENQFLKSELGTAERAQALVAFQRRTPSRMIAARLIGAGMGDTARTIFVDRGTSSGVKRGMAVITPDGIVGRVLAAFPASSQVMLVTDSSFAAGAVSEKFRLNGTLRGDGTAFAKVDYLPNEAKVVVGEWFYTSGDDRVFPRGLPVGQVTSSVRGREFRDIVVALSGVRRGIEEVLIVLDGVHEPLPSEGNGQPTGGEVSLLPPPAGTETAPPAEASSVHTDADRVLDRYRLQGEQQGHKFGSGGVPNFNAPIAPLAPSPIAVAGTDLGAASVNASGASAPPAVKRPAPPTPVQQ